MYGDEAHQQLRREREEFAAKLDAEQWAEGSELEALLAAADTDRNAARLIALARLLDAESFAIRESRLAWVAKERVGRRGNDPHHQYALRVHERVARLSISYAVKQARSVLALVQSWGDEG